MGVNVLIDSTTMKDIADAIREKNKTTTEYLPSEMAAAISKLPEIGFLPINDKKSEVIVL